MVLITKNSERRPDLLASVLEEAEVGIAVVEGEGSASYVNASARRYLACDPAGRLPDWVRSALTPLLERLWHNGSRAVERWVHADQVLRVHARPIDRARAVAALEITADPAASGGPIGERLSRALDLSMPDARLLAFVWRGMSNEDIARTLNVRLGTVKSRLFRLYQKLGVKNRATAVLRAAEVLKDARPDAAV